MKALLFTNLFPSAVEPSRGLFNLRGFDALTEFCDARVVAPVSGWRRLTKPGAWIRVPEERHRNLIASYPTYWTVPKLGRRLHADAMYRSVHHHVSQLHRVDSFNAILGAFAYPDAVAAARLARDLGVGFVAFVLGSDINELAQRPALRPQIRAALLQADSVIAVSDALRSRVLELGIPAERVILQRNGVEGERFFIREQAASRRLLGITAEAPLVCFVGNLAQEKGPDILMEALGHLPHVHAVFIGGGHLREALELRIERLNMTDRVRLLGRRTPDDVALWMSAADMLCLPSRREGCPNVVLEALASGRPVVAAAVGGVPELLSQETGILVPADDPRMLAEGIAGALRREWSPDRLRASVPSLSWRDLGETLYNALRHASSR